MQNLEIVVLLLFGVSILALVSNRLGLPLPIVLICSGLLLSLIPWLPEVNIGPEIVFLVFLPPLLYSAAWDTDWSDFKTNIKAISFAAIGLVLLTTTGVGVLLHYLIPGCPWSIAFLVGAIISPPDAVAATSLTKGLGLPPRVINILEGESLINDASALIAFKYALGAVLAGTFSLGGATIDFFKVFAGGIAIGFLLSWLLYWLHRKWVHDPVLDVTLTILTPYAAYLLAEQFHFSGVLAVVTAGLYLSYRAARIFSNESRIQAIGVWEVLVFILNALVFILMGLQLRSVVAGFSLTQILTLALWSGAVWLVALAVRFLSTVPLALFPHLGRKRGERPVDRRHLVVFGIAGMRGIVSMAAALSVPALLPAGGAFPFRAEIIFITFGVIMLSLLVQGLSLPWIVRRMRMPKHSILKEEYKVREGMISDLRGYIQDHAEMSEEVRKMLLDNYNVRYHLLQQTRLPDGKMTRKQSAATLVFNEFAERQLELLKRERKLANELRTTGKASEQVLRKLEREIDLEEARLKLELYVE